MGGNFRGGRLKLLGLKGQRRKKKKRKETKTKKSNARTKDPRGNGLTIGEGE